MYLKQLLYFPIIPIVAIIIGILLNWFFWCEAQIFFQYSVPASISIAFTISLQAWIKFGNMPKLEIPYDPDDHNELYHHKDVPINLEGQGNYVLVGVKNVGSGIAKNCRAKLSIFSDERFMHFFDNPFGLYFSHDPASSEGKLPTLFDLPHDDSVFLSVCYIRNDGRFFFDDHGQFTRRRDRKLAGLPRGAKCFYVKVTVYSENSASDEEYFRIKTTGVYPDLTMTKISPEKRQGKRQQRRKRRRRQAFTSPFSLGMRKH